MTRLTISILFSCLGTSFVASGQTQIMTTVAGNGTAGFSGDSGQAASAELNQPSGVAIDASGNIYIADTNNNRVRKVSPGGVITTVTGAGGVGFSPALSQPSAVFVDGSGNLFIADPGNYQIREVSASGVITTVAGSGTFGFSGDGGPATASDLNQPQGVFVDASGNIFIADTASFRIRKVTASNGNISTVAGNGTQGYAGDGGLATSAELNNPTGVFVDSAGNIYIADSGNNRVRKVSTSGNITTIAGTGTAGYFGDNGLATSAFLYNPTGVAVDTSGNVFIAVSTSSRIRMISTSGIITTVAGNGNAGFSGDSGPATSASLSHPKAIALDPSGDLFIADTGNNRIREAAVSTVPPPTINSGGIVAVDSTVTTIQAGEWVSIYGANLANTTASWAGDFPVSLGGASVTIDGNQAYLSYVSPGQINLQAPNDVSTGSVAVVVRTAGGNATSSVTLSQFAPSFLLFDNKHVTGYIPRNGTGSQGGGAYDFLGPTGNSLGYPTVAAKAGDTVVIYAVGLGPTNPPVQAGQLFSAWCQGTCKAQTVNPVTLLINNVSVTPDFAGFSPSLLYQINVKIPTGLGTGDVPLVASVGGVQTQTGVVISLQ